MTAVGRAARIVAALAACAFLAGAAGKAEQRAWRVIEEGADDPQAQLLRAVAYLEEYPGGEYALPARRVAGEAAFALQDWSTARRHLEAWLTLGGREGLDGVRLLIARAVLEGGQRENGLAQLGTVATGASDLDVARSAGRELVAQHLFAGDWRAALDAQAGLLRRGLFEADADLPDARAAAAAAAREAKTAGRSFDADAWRALERAMQTPAGKGLVGFLALDAAGELRDDPSTEPARRSWALRFPEHPLAPAVPGAEGFASAPEDSKGDVIGLLLPTSGRFAAPAELVRRGVDLALAVGEERGWPKVTLAVADAKGEGAAAAEGMRRLIEVDKAVAVLGPLVTAEAEAVVPVATERGTPTIMLTQTPSLAGGSRFVANAWVHPDAQVRAIVEHAVGRLGLSQFAIAYPNKEGAAALAGAFWEEVHKAGGVVTSVESYEAEATDFRELGRRLKGSFYKASPPGEGDRGLPYLGARSKPQLDAGRTLEPGVDFQAIFVPDSYRRVAMIAPGLIFEEINVGGHLRATRDKEHAPVVLLGGSALNHPDLAARGGGYTEGTTFVDGFFVGSDEDVVEAFVGRYRAAYGADPSILEALAYDATLFLLQLLADGATTRREITRRLTLATPVESVTGARGFDADGAMVHELKTLMVRKGAIVQVWPAPAEPAPATP